MLNVFVCDNLQKLNNVIFFIFLCFVFHYFCIPTLSINWWRDGLTKLGWLKTWLIDGLTDAHCIKEQTCIICHTYEMLLFKEGLSIFNFVNIWDFFIRGTSSCILRVPAILAFYHPCPPETTQFKNWSSTCWQVGSSFVGEKGEKIVPEKAAFVCLFKTAFFKGDERI